MQLHHSRWLVAGSLPGIEMEIVFRPGGKLEVLERDETIGRKNTWKINGQQVEFSICHPVTMIRHTHFCGRLMNTMIKGICIRITGESAAFEAELVQQHVEPGMEQPLIIGSWDVSFFLAHGLNLN